MNTIRIEAPELVGHKTRVFFVADDGTETEISSCVTAVHFNAKVGDANTATLELIKVTGTQRAELVGLLVEELRPRGRAAWLRRKLRDVTHFGSRWQEYA